MVRSKKKLWPLLCKHRAFIPSRLCFPSPCRYWLAWPKEELIIGAASCLHRMRFCILTAASYQCTCAVANSLAIDQDANQISVSSMNSELQQKFTSLTQVHVPDIVSYNNGRAMGCPETCLWIVGWQDDKHMVTSRLSSWVVRESIFKSDVFTHRYKIITAYWHGGRYSHIC